MPGSPASPDYQFSAKPLIAFGPGFPAVDEVTSPRIMPASGGAMMQDPAAYAGFASVSFTISGTIGVGPVVTITVNSTAQGYTYVAGDSSTTLAATHIAAALNGNGTIAAQATATSSTNVVTLTALVQGQPGMLSVLEAATGGATVTLSNLASSTVTVGGTVGVGPTASIIINGQTVTYTYVGGDTTTTIAAADIAAAINGAGSVNTAVKAVASGSAFTVTSINGKSFTIATNPTGGATLSASSELDFVSPNVVYPLSTFSWPTDFGLIMFWLSSPREVDNATRTALKLAALVA